MTGIWRRLGRRHLFIDGGACRQDLHGRAVFDLGYRIGCRLSVSCSALIGRWQIMTGE
jgi:hypothetical protein